jgi:hypothetical protein
VMILEEFSGCGKKSHACRHMETRGHKVLYVCPANKLASNCARRPACHKEFFERLGTMEQTQMAVWRWTLRHASVRQDLQQHFGSWRRNQDRTVMQRPDRTVIAAGAHSTAGKHKLVHHELAQLLQLRLQGAH